MPIKLLSAAAITALMCLSAACGADDSTTGAGGDTVQVDVGTDTPIEVPTGALRVGWFTSGSTNEWLQTLTQTMEKKADEYGWENKVYDPAWDPAKQLDQIQNAIQKNEIDAAVVLPIDGALACQATTDQLPQAGILTVVMTVPVCGHDGDDGPGSYEPGLLSFVGSIGNVPYNKAWIEAAAELNPGPQEVAIIEGPATGQAVAIDAALDQFNAENPDSEFHVEHLVETDYTTVDGLAKTQALLSANPDLSVIMSVYSPDLTRGVLQAVDEAGKSDDITVIDVGANKWSYEQLTNGAIQMTMPNRPVDMMTLAMDAIKLAQDGEKVATFYDDQPEGYPSDNPLVITRDNMSDYQPQY